MCLSWFKLKSPKKNGQKIIRMAAWPSQRSQISKIFHFHGIVIPNIWKNKTSSKPPTRSTSFPFPWLYHPLLPSIFVRQRQAANDAGALPHEVVGAEAHGAEVAVVRVPLDAGDLGSIHRFFLWGKMMVFQAMKDGLTHGEHNGAMFDDFGIVGHSWPKKLSCFGRVTLILIIPVRTVRSLWWCLKPVTHPLRRWFMVGKLRLVKTKWGEQPVTPWYNGEMMYFIQTIQTSNFEVYVGSRLHPPVITGLITHYIHYILLTQGISYTY